MKKILLSLLAVGVCGSFPLIASAAVSGKCSKCHTMHNSQNDSYMNLDRPWKNDSDQNEILLRSDCLGCHSGKASDNEMGGTNDDMRAPRVLIYSGTYSNESAYTWLPGGYFDMARTNTQMRHNVVDLPAPLSANDSLMARYMVQDLAPPGYTRVNNNRPLSSAAWSSQLSCAGTWGCHGKTANDDTRDTAMQGISGHHHGNDSPYRYLRITETNVAVKGTGIAWSAWNDTTSGPKDNKYFANESGLDAGNDIPTISRFCAECHGNFHASSVQTNISQGTIGATGQSWLRHPTDLKMSTTRHNLRTGTRDNWNTAVTSNMVPIGSNDSASLPSASTNAYVICLSCHVAHGGGYKDLLRWSYDLMSAGTYGAGKATGCFICHTAKDNGHGN